MKGMFSVIAAIATTTSALADPVRVTQFNWLSGCWAFATDTGRYEEIWTAPSGNSMLGVSRRLENGYTREYEYMRIVTSGGGGFDFIARPKDSEETSFNASSFSDKKVVFENPDHDFPQKITYELVAPDQVHARIEGPSKGHTMTLNFPLKREACPSSP